MSTSRQYLPLRILAGALLFASLGPKHDALAQTVTGTIVGTVKDQTDAVLPGVAITVTNQATNVAKTFTSNQVGEYVAPFLSPGTYSVAAEAPGFKKEVITGVVVQVEQRRRVDLSLTVGQVSETVEVQSEAPLLNTESSSIGQVIDNRNVADLPLNGRQFMELAFLVPATHASAPGHFNAILQGVAMTSSGGRPTNNNFQLDGVANMSVSCGYFAVSPSVDAVQEFKIQTSNYSAEFGQTSGAVINVATKSGTNRLHGSAYDFLRNDVFDARNFFNRTGKAEPLKRNEFGGSIGAPVVIPGLYNGKNRTFFFYNQEHLKERKAEVRVARIPTAPLTTGNFTNAGYTVYDPRTLKPNPSGSGSVRDPFPGNRIPDTRISPVSKKVLTFYPQPNNPGDPQRNFINNSPSRRDNYQVNTRVDHQISPKDNFYVRYSQSNLVVLSPGFLGGGMGDVGIDNLGKNAGINWVHTFNAQVVNEARGGYSRLNFKYGSPRAGTNFAPDLGISGVPTNSKLSVFPIFSITGFTGLGDTEPYGSIDNIYQLIDTFSWVKRKHSMKFGIDVRRVQDDYYIARSPSGSYSLNGQFTGVPGVPLREGLADFLLGLPASSNITYIGEPGRTRTTNWNLFFQDDWKISPKLTLNLGLRYELVTPPIEKNGRQGYMNPVTGVLVYTKDAPLNNPIPGTGITEADMRWPHEKVNRNSLMIGDKNNFAPRIGFAYEFLPRTVLRGGYGVSYVYFPFSDFGVNSQRFSPFAIQVSNTSDAFTPTIGTFNFTPGGAAEVLRRAPRLSFAGISPDVQWGDVHQWSMSIQRSISRTIVMEVGYQGNKSSHLAQRWPANNPLTAGPGSVDSRRPFQAFGSVSQVQSDINNFYNAMTVRVEKRYGGGYSLLGSYTWAKSIGYGSEVYGTPGQEGGFQHPTNRRLDRGLSPDDVRQRLSLSGTWELPVGRDRRFLRNAAVPIDILLGGWQVNTIIALQTGFHITVTGGAFLNNGWATRPDQVGDPNRNFTFSVDQAFNTKAFARPAQYVPGTAARGSVELPGTENIDLSVFKNTRVGERLNVQFRFEMFNMANHANFACYACLPSRSFDSASFGRIFAAQDPRLIQMALKLIF